VQTNATRVKVFGSGRRLQKGAVMQITFNGILQPQRFI
jgi:hypothetical protein